MTSSKAPEVSAAQKKKVFKNIEKHLKNKPEAWAVLDKLAGKSHLAELLTGYQGVLENL